MWNRPSRTPQQVEDPGPKFGARNWEHAAGHGSCVLAQMEQRFNALGRFLRTLPPNVSEENSLSRARRGHRGQSKSSVNEVPRTQEEQMDAQRKAPLLCAWEVWDCDLEHDVPGLLIGSIQTHCA